MTPSTARHRRSTRLGMWDVTFGLADQLRRGDAPGGLTDRRAAGSRATSTTSSCSAWGAAASPVTCWPPLAGPSSPVPVVVVKDSAVPGVRRAAHAGGGAVRSRARRPRPSPARRRLLERGAAIVVGVRRRRRWPRWPSDARRRASLAVDGTIPMPRAALGAMVAPVLAVAEDVGVLAGAREQVAAAVAAAPPARRGAGPAGERGRGAGPDHRPHLAAGLRRRAASARSPPYAGRTRSTRTPRRRPSATPCPRCATTSCAAGASTAT